MSARPIALFAVALCVGAVPALAQDLVIPKVVYPDIAPHAANAEGFKPAGWKVEKAISGDLNGDGAADLVLVLKDDDPKNVIDNPVLGPEKFDTNPRMLVIAFADKSGGYDLAVANHLLIPRATQPNLEDFLSEGGGVSVKNGALRVSLYLFADAGGWDMGTTTYTFRWQHGRFELIGYDNDDVQRNTGETTDLSINYSTGKMATSTGRIDSNIKKTTWAKAPAGPPLPFEAVGDGMGFDPKTPTSPGAPDEP
jgi:hypothetical protein